MEDAARKTDYRRVIVKFSGEALMGAEGACGIDSAVVADIASEVKALVATNTQVGVVLGGGNFFRGAKLNQAGISRVTADHLGMVATLLNALAMRDVFEHANIPTKIMSALPIGGVVERYVRNTADEYLKQGNVVIFAGGTGNPFVTTDTALGLRGVELDADLLIKATNVDGIYSSDPELDSSATLYKHLTYQEVLAKELAVMDLAAFCLCRDHKMKIRVFNMHKTGALLRIVEGDDEGTLVE